MKKVAPKKEPKKELTMKASGHIYLMMEARFAKDYVVVCW